MRLTPPFLLLLPKQAQGLLAKRTRRRPPLDAMEYRRTTAHYPGGLSGPPPFGHRLFGARLEGPYYRAKPPRSNDSVEREAASLTRRPAYVPRNETPTAWTGAKDILCPARKRK
jgi:hypothetical protein